MPQSCFFRNNVKLSFPGKPQISDISFKEFQTMKFSGKPLQLNPRPFSIFLKAVRKDDLPENHCLLNFSNIVQDIRPGNAQMSIAFAPPVKPLVTVVFKTTNELVR